MFFYHIIDYMFRFRMCDPGVFLSIGKCLSPPSRLGISANVIWGEKMNSGREKSARNLKKKEERDKEKEERGKEKGRKGKEKEKMGSKRQCFGSGSPRIR
jgi:hypothetical protein